MALAKNTKSEITDTLWVFDKAVSDTDKQLLFNQLSQTWTTKWQNGHLWVVGHRSQLRAVYNQVKASVNVTVVGLEPSGEMCCKWRASNRMIPHVGTPFTPLDLAQIYSFPSGNGNGQTIGIISLGGGYYLNNITTYLANLGLALANPINDVSIMGATNNPGVVPAFDIENTLDIEVIAALVPNAQLNVYFCPGVGLAGFYAGINQAITDGCDIISISWGFNEAHTPNSDLINFNTLFETAATNGISVFIAIGDNGSYGIDARGLGFPPGDNVDFPSCCPFATGCGGTTLVAPGNVRVSETIWNNDSYENATGGGISRIFFIPDYQLTVSKTYNLGGYRMVGDVCGFADENPGFSILYDNGIDPPTTSVGGTSGTAPMYAGLFGRINQNNGHNSGFINPTIYINQNAFYPITTGNNGSYFSSNNPNAPFSPPTGVGSPNGLALQSIFA